MPEHFHRQGQVVPVVAFYSIQGGVGKTTISRKFAELVTRATSAGGQHPNVLLVDLDVETQGLSYRVMGTSGGAGGTIHDAIAAQNPNTANAQNVTANISIASASTPGRGQLYLLPAAHPTETRLFEVIKNTPLATIKEILQQTIDRLVQTFPISCVVIDCAPGGMPYSAAAATLADVPVLVGRNEAATYEQIHVQAQRFHQLYPEFQPARQSVVINAVSVREFYEQRAQRYAVADWIPLTSDVIHETEGLANPNTLQMLLFENYIIDLIKKFLIGRDHLIPKAHDVLTDEWLEMLSALQQADRAPRLVWNRRLGVLLPIGIVVVVVGVITLYFRDAERFVNYSSQLSSGGMGLVVGGAIAAAIGGWALYDRAVLERGVREVLKEGPEGVFRRIKGTASERQLLQKMQRFARAIPRRATASAEVMR